MSLCVPGALSAPSKPTIRRGTSSGSGSQEGCDVQQKSRTWGPAFALLVAAGRWRRGEEKTEGEEEEEEEDQQQQQQKETRIDLRRTG
ncbi:unnamed protein product [Diplocarpon coronariae]|uniref:Uncharacterized protein n=1 Tax=Diplocarpon coronariae TaxID=2795749 RepID=A0A218ZH06_9HELO|nr:hypothetical protein B2J93_7778 [Marssonina coronariae]